jgi:hypothetical protein
VHLRRVPEPASKGHRGGAPRHHTEWLDERWPEDQRGRDCCKRGAEHEPSRTTGDETSTQHGPAVRTHGSGVRTTVQPPRDAGRTVAVAYVSRF